jgi:two-component system cell cycle sensor histidine kinase/response regulator CckA
VQWRFGCSVTVQEAAQAGWYERTPDVRLENGMKTQNHETILLVDDEPAVVQLAREMLLRQGHTVLEATEGEEALSIAQRHPTPIHLLLTDIVMPQMNGHELARRITAARPDTKVLFMSGFMPEAILKYYGISTTRDSFLQKPFTSKALAEKVGEALREPFRSASGIAR